MIFYRTFSSLPVLVSLDAEASGDLGPHVLDDLLVREVLHLMIVDRHQDIVLLQARPIRRGLRCYRLNRRGKVSCRGTWVSSNLSTTSIYADL